MIIVAEEAEHSKFIYLIKLMTLVKPGIQLYTVEEMKQKMEISFPIYNWPYITSMSTLNPGVLLSGCLRHHTQVSLRKFAFGPKRSKPVTPQVLAIAHHGYR